ncbi:MAG TPA: hypothetical protein VMV46_09735 [Thermoanaerobaculia bacterium]|nr:hypothetical protein [Thermoanaerobaculia bacterium]
MIRRFARALARVMLWEIRERRAVLAAGLLAGLLVPVVGMLSDRDIVATAGGLSIAFGAVVALVFGATMLSSDLVEGRLGFFLSQPIPTQALYWGRLLGASIAAVACQLACVVPALLLLRPRFLDATLVEWWLSVFLTIPALVALGHVVASIFRLRTAWLALDLAAALAVTLLVAGALRTATLVGPLQVAPLFVVVLSALAAAVALLLAGPLQLSHGRTDRVRSHRWLSIGLWTVPLVTAGTLAVSAGSWARLDPDEITPDRVAAPTSATAEWIAVEGWHGVPGWNAHPPTSAQRTSVWSTICRSLAPDPRRHAYAALLVRPRDGAWRRLPPGSEQVRISDDGRWVTWVGREAGSSDRQLHRLDIDSIERAERAVSPRPTNLGWSRLPAQYDLSPDGTRVGVLSSPRGAPGRLAIHDLDTGGLVAQSGVLPNNGALAFGWIDDRRLRMLSRVQACRIDTLDAVTGEHDGIEIPSTAGNWPWCTTNLAGDRFLFASEEGLTVYDEDGSDLATRALESQRVFPRILDGDVFLTFDVEDGFDLLRLDLETLETRGRWETHDRRPSPVARIGPSSVLIRDGSTQVLDLESGTFVPLPPALRRSPLGRDPQTQPAVGRWPIRFREPEAGSLAAHLFRSDDHGIFLVDLAADSWSPVIPPRQPSSPERRGERPR